MTNIVHGHCKDCGSIFQDGHFSNYCKPCIGKRISKGKVRGMKRTRAIARPDGVDIDAIHFNPRWMKAK